MPTTPLDQSGAAPQVREDADELDRMLRAVERIADGIGSMHELAVAFTRARGGQPWTQTPEARRELIRFLRGRLAEANISGMRQVNVHVDDLRELLTVFEAAQERS